MGMSLFQQPGLWPATSAARTFTCVEVGPSSSKGQRMEAFSGAGGAGQQDREWDWGVSAHLLHQSSGELSSSWTAVWDTPLAGAALQLFGMQITTASDFPVRKEAEDSSKNTSQQDRY